MQASGDRKSIGNNLTLSELKSHREESNSVDALTSSRALAEHREHIQSSEAFAGGTP